MSGGLLYSTVYTVYLYSFLTGIPQICTRSTAFLIILTNSGVKGAAAGTMICSIHWYDDSQRLSFIKLCCQEEALRHHLMQVFPDLPVTISLFWYCGPGRLV